MSRSDVMFWAGGFLALIAVHSLIKIEQYLRRIAEYIERRWPQP